MVMTDPLADMFTRIRNANQVYNDVAEIPMSKIKLDVTKVLTTEGYVEGYKTSKRGVEDVIEVKLKYGPNRRRVISGIKRISKPGLRVYVGKDEIPKVLGGLGTAVLSTSKGILTDKQARRAQLGGEVICYIW